MQNRRSGDKKTKDSASHAAFENKTERNINSYSHQIQSEFLFRESRLLETTYMAITPKIAWTIKLEWEFLQYILHGFSSLKNQIPCWVDLLRFQNHTLNSVIASMAIPPKKKNTPLAISSYAKESEIMLPMPYDRLKLTIMTMLPFKSSYLLCIW